jgi:hypothetical protein
MSLATTQKGSSTIAKYFSMMKSLVDDMSSAGKKLDDEELCSYLLAGLDAEYNSLASSTTAPTPSVNSIHRVLPMRLR